MDVTPQVINVFSYGSGAASTMFRLRVNRMPGIVENIHEVLAALDRLLSKPSREPSWSLRWPSAGPQSLTLARGCVVAGA